MHGSLKELNEAMKESLEGKKKTAVCDDAKALPAQERESNHTGNPVPEKESES